MQPARRTHAPRRPPPLALALLATVVLVYAPVLGAGFVWDDAGHLTPPSLRGLAGLARIWSEPGATQQHYPLVHTLFWLEHALWGTAPLGYHVVNVALHATAALLLARLLLRLAFPGAWLAAFAFALHPLQVESVAWISEQKNTLSACFYLAAWSAWTRFDEALARGERPRAWGAWAASFALALAAALSKTVTATLVPAILLVTWGREGGRAWMRRVAWLAPHLVCASALALVTPWLERHVGGARGAAYEMSFAERCVVAGKDLWFYLGALAWPWQPSFVYPRWTTDAKPAGLAAPVGFALLLAALFALRGRVGRAPFAALAFFAGTLFPALRFFDAVPFRYSFVADHFQYLACLGPLAAGSAALALAHARGAPARRWLLAGTAALLVGAWGVRSFAHARDFRSSETLWRATLAANPDAWLARENLMHELVRAGRADEAILLGERGLARHPERATLRANLGVALQASGELEQALARFDEALALDPTSIRAAFDRASALAEFGRAPDALVAVDEVLAREPALVVAHVLRGNVLLALGRSDEALAAHERALALDPAHAQGWFNLGVVRERRGELALAEAAYRRAAGLDPTDLGAGLNRGIVLARLGRTGEARAQLELVLRGAAGSPLAARAAQALSLLGSR